jgi:hypothetical protein
MQGAQKLRNEAHLRVRRNDEVEAQRSRWTFYEVIRVNRPKGTDEGGRKITILQLPNRKRCKIVAPGLRSPLRKIYDFPHIIFPHLVYYLVLIRKLPLPFREESVLYCHCEGVKRLKQSHNLLKIIRLPRSLLSLAMTDQDCGTVSRGEGE